MHPIALLLILAGVLLNAGAQLLLKAGTNRVGVVSFRVDNWFDTALRIASQWPFIAGFVCYGISVIIWIMALSRVPVSVAYPMLSLGYVVNAIAAWYLFGEVLSPMRLGGITLIIAGVYLLTRTL